MKIKLCLILALSSMHLFFRCTGGSTESTNQFIIGMVYEPDGITPARHALVVIRPQNTLAPISWVPSEIASSAIDTVFTNNSGRFVIEKDLDSGLYAIEASKDSNIVFVNSIDIKTDVINPIVLKPAGSITGTIFLAGKGDPTNVYILAFGIDRFTQVNSDGKFTFNNLGEGIYHLKIITTLMNYGSLDTSGISVSSSDTTDIGTIPLPYSGVAIPRNIRVAYFSGASTATISWDKVNDPRVKYYNIFRESEVVLSEEYSSRSERQLNTSMITDTFFIDKIVGDAAQGVAGNNPPILWYSVSVVDSDETETLRSDKVKISPKTTIVVAEEIDSAKFKMELSPVIDFDMTADGNTYLLTDLPPHLLILDKSYACQRVLLVNSLKDTTPDTVSFRPGALCIGGNPELLYLTNSDNTKIIRFTIDGTCIDTIYDAETRLTGIADLEIIDTTLYVMSRGDSLLSFSQDNKRMSAWHVQGGRCIANGGNGKVVVGTSAANGQICWYTSTGVLLTSVKIEGLPVSIGIDTVRQLSYVVVQSSSMKLLVYDKNNNIAGTFVTFVPYIERSSEVHYFRMQILQSGEPLVTEYQRLVKFNFIP